RGPLDRDADQDLSEDGEQATDGEDPTQLALAVEEQDTDADQERQHRQAEARRPVSSPETEEGVRGSHLHLVQDQVAAEHRQDQTDEERAEAAGRATGPTETSTAHQRFRLFQLREISRALLARHRHGAILSWRPGLTNPLWKRELGRRKSDAGPPQATADRKSVV